MNAKIRQFLQRMRAKDEKVNQKIEAVAIPRNISIRGILHYLARRKDRGPSKQ